MRPSFFFPKSILSSGLCLLPIFLLLFSCGGTPHLFSKKKESGRKSASSSPAKEKISSHIVLTRAPKNLPENLQDNYSHPFSISESEISFLLQSLSYEEWDRMGIFGKPKPIFSAPDIDQLAQELPSGLQHANKDQVIRFQVGEEKSQTTGYVFVAEDKMYWNFTWINGLSFEYKDPYKHSWGEKNENPPPNWRLTEKKGQKLFVYTGIISKYGQENFLILSLKYYGVAGYGGEREKEKGKRKSGSERGETVQDKPKIELKGSLLERYQDLKKLKQEKIISAAEYEKKARELMREERNLIAPEEIKLLNYFRMDGFITEEEYEEKKKKLLEKL